MGDPTVIDPSLDTVEGALDAAVLVPRLQPLIDRWLGRSAPIDAFAAEVVRRRNKRCVLRYELRAGGAPLALFGKVFQPGCGEAIHVKMRRLWAQGFHRDAPDRIHMPQPLGFVPELRLLVLEAVPGRSFKERLLEDPDPMVMRRMARVAAKLHGCGSWPGPAFRMPQHLARCHPQYPRLAERCPEMAEGVALIARRATELEDRIPRSRFSAIHGDLHLSQTLMAEGVSYLIDFDSLALGDPAADLANLLVFLRSKREIPGLEALIGAFLDEYFGSMDPAIGARIPLYEAATELRRACKDLRLGRPGWRARAGERIARGVACLEGAAISD